MSNLKYPKYIKNMAQTTHLNFKWYSSVSKTLVLSKIKSCPTRQQFSNKIIGKLKWYKKVLGFAHRKSSTKHSVKIL